MTAIDTHATLAALVTARPALAAALDRVGLDYCCGGNRTLTEAVHAAGLDLDTVVEDLTELTSQSGADPVVGAEDWTVMSLRELVDHLEATHHAYLREALPRATALADKVASVHGERHPELHRVDRLITELRAELEPHLAKEERILFPMIRELDTATQAPQFHCGSSANPIRLMGIEHDHAGELLSHLRAATAGYTVPADGCNSYRALYVTLGELEADTHLHVHKENNLLFPGVLAAEAALGGSPR
ncbi:MAG: iron-sulfur cluster repair di-iron protein [Acidimicrobiales bacterium]|jgi:regulator of cell morphogenesis and NO signaling|nr:iron-sulfur cluster repair di-iron protein [Acidimicrobiales bacterium]